MEERGDPTTDLLRGTPSVTLAAVDLSVLMGPDQGLTRRLQRGTVRIGTSHGCDLRLTDPTVSRLHCELKVQPNGFRLTDFESTNGTFIDSVRIFDGELRGGATITVGATVLRLDVANESVRIPLSPADRFGGLLGGSAEMRRIYAILSRAALSDTTVLVEGETGTGKEAVAEALHRASSRIDGPFVAIDCGAIAESLIESELFGHVRGSFSGAVADRVGLFEQAHGGTLFLDEIGELPLSLQPKLLRALETREVRRVGSNAARAIDVRVIAATNRRLASAVNEGTFREDLYYRLSVIEVALPPLRGRREDIPQLAQHFYASFLGRDEPLPPALIPTLVAKAWPGNVRELRNFVERHISLGWSGDHGEAPAGQPLPVPAGLHALVPIDMPIREARDLWTSYFERLYVAALLEKTRGNVTRAAERAGIARRSLHRLMAAQGIHSVDYDEDAGNDDDAK